MTLLVLGDQSLEVFMLACRGFTLFYDLIGFMWNVLKLFYPPCVHLAPWQQAFESSAGRTSIEMPLD